MANEIEVKFGELEFESGTEFAIETVEEEEDKDVVLHKIPKSEGSIAETARRNSLNLLVEGTIGNSDYDALRSSIDTLNAALHNGKQKFTRDDDRYVMAQLKKFKKAWITMRTLAKFSASFIAEYPFWLSETESEDERVPTSGTGYTINNAGNAPARVKIAITAPAGGISDAIKIENQTNGKAFQFRGDVAAGETLIVDNRYDTNAFAVLNNDDDDMPNFEGDFIELDPGDNTIIFTGTADSVVKITYRDTWY